MPTLHLPAGLRDFLDFCRARVTEDDIEAGIMSDPGSQGYSRECNEIRISGKVPASYSVFLDEVFSTVHICIRLEDRLDGTDPRIAESLSTPRLGYRHSRD
jgi:hypothetical protein